MKRPGIILGLVVVAVVGIGVAHYMGIIPPKSGLEGTIGAAKRYQATQITDKDVVLADPQIQALLQSDLFHKVIATPEFKKLSQNEEFWRLVTTADFRKTFVVPDADGGRTAVRPTEDGKTAVRPTEDFGKTAVRPTEDGKTAVRPTEDGKTAVRPTEDFGRTAVRPTEDG